jgi:hypothetical protein
MLPHHLAREASYEYIGRLGGRYQLTPKIRLGWSRLRPAGPGREALFGLRSVSIQTYAKRSFTVLGQVQRPGSYEIVGDQSISLLQAVGVHLGSGSVELFGIITTMNRSRDSKPIHPALGIIAGRSVHRNSTFLPRLFRTLRQMQGVGHTELVFVIFRHFGVFQDHNDSLRSRSQSDINGAPYWLPPFIPFAVPGSSLFRSLLAAVVVWDDVFPGKLLRAFTAGKPVMAICDADSELATVVQTKGWGIARCARCRGNRDARPITLPLPDSSTRQSPRQGSEARVRSRPLPSRRCQSCEPLDSP